MKDAMQEERIYRHTEDGVFNAISWLFDEIKLTHQTSAFHAHCRMLTSKPDDVVRLHFGLKGNYSFSYRQLGQDFDLVGGHHNLMFSDGFDMEVRNKTMAIETFGVQFSRRAFLAFAQDADDSLKRFCDAVAHRRAALLSHQWGAVSPAVQNIIRQVVQCSYQGKMKQIFLLSKCLELLVLTTAELAEHANHLNALPKRGDKDRIVAARDMINERLQSPPTLSEVARDVGLNEFKLKRGFKAMFKTSVFGYLTEQRLLLAYQYLCDTDKTAAEIAYMMGYASPQHFNNAFKKRFGCTPVAVRRSTVGR